MDCAEDDDEAEDAADVEETVVAAPCKACEVAEDEFGPLLPLPAVAEVGVDEVVVVLEVVGAGK